MPLFEFYGWVIGKGFKIYTLAILGLRVGFGFGWYSPLPTFRVYIFRLRKDRIFILTAPRQHVLYSYRCTLRRNNSEKAGEC